MRSWICSIEVALPLMQLVTYVFGDPPPPPQYQPPVIEGHQPVGDQEIHPPTYSNPVPHPTYSNPLPAAPAAYNNPGQGPGYNHPVPPGYGHPVPSGPGYSHPVPSEPGYSHPVPSEPGYSHPVPPGPGYSNPHPAPSGPGYSHAAPHGPHPHPHPHGPGYSAAAPHPPHGSGYSDPDAEGPGYSVPEGYGSPPPPPHGYGSGPPPPPPGYSGPPPGSAGGYPPPHPQRYPPPPPPGQIPRQAPHAPPPVNVRHPLRSANTQPTVTGTAGVFNCVDDCHGSTRCRECTTYFLYADGADPSAGSSLLHIRRNPPLIGLTGFTLKIRFRFAAEVNELMTLLHLFNLDREYEHPTDTLALAIAPYKGIIGLLVYDKHVAVTADVNDQLWHCLVWTWDQHGVSAVFVDGQRLEQVDSDEDGPIDLSSATSIGGGLGDHLIIGQWCHKTRETCAGCEPACENDPGSSFSGYISDLNIWDFGIEEGEVRDLCARCGYEACGNVINWPDQSYVAAEGVGVVALPDDSRDHPPCCSSGTRGLPDAPSIK